MKKLAFLAMFVAVTLQAADKSADIRYAGLGRYTCSGDKYKCAQIDANNRALEERDRQRWERDREREREQHHRDLELYGVRR